MTPPKEKVWTIEPHTKAKHLILKQYLKAWFPILAKWNGRIIYYDGFAGPGEYSGGEQGSPLIALNVAKGQLKHLRNNELVFIFVEEDKDRADHLKGTVEQQPSTFKVEVINNNFESALVSTLDSLDEEGSQIAPTFAFIDPFGINGLPFGLIKRFLQNDKCEAMITFMHSTMERFVTELPDQTNKLIGNTSASEIITSSNNRIAKARELYEQSLRKAAKFVRSFEMRNRHNRPIYDLFFATKHPLGHKRMKEAMWTVDRLGLFSFSDGVNPGQRVLFSPTPERDLEPIIWGKFQGRENIDCSEVLEYTNDETAFLEQHARKVLKLLESENGYNSHKIKVEPKKIDGKKRRRGKFTKGTIIKFAEKG